MEKLTFCCVLLLSFGAISRARFLDDRFPLLLSTWTFPSVHAEKLIRKLNLFPEKGVHIVRDGDASLLDGRKRIVEKRFMFPNVVDDEYGEVSVKDLGHHAGYYKIANSHAARMFYFFFESRNSRKDPVVILLTGGPGCSSELAMFYENGPFTIADNMSLAWNPYGWDQLKMVYFILFGHMLALRVYCHGSNRPSSLSSVNDP
ncbi:serine carboxypeptidase-like 49 [Hevea brasiliensis]|uniref:serine carboxypeptidase-like 49 n=1 Tax=Hevea brasiliensis TaxID=3981 RepID=UPI0025E7D24D|nr:serine carboxypeptidase-like 49 [Hevea brasiliensis]